MFRNLSNESCNGSQVAKHWRQVSLEKLLRLAVSGERVDVGFMKNASGVENEEKLDLVWAK